MAYIATVKILVAQSNEDAVNESIENLLHGFPSVVDSTITSVERVNATLAESIYNGEKYVVGDFCKDWVIFSAQESEKEGEAMFWSNEYGWTTLDLATKFDGVAVTLPMGDSHWMIAPYGKNWYRVSLDSAKHKDPIDCFAVNADDAYEVAWAIAHHE